MTTILNIETATKVCSVAIAKDGILMSLKENNNDDYTHAENLSLFIDEAIKEAGINYQSLDAVAISMGPGSYTGLRIGTSTAKGICYALDIPLIAVSTLQAMSFKASSTLDMEPHTLWCPMIDARRMEVYAAIFDRENNLVREIQADIVDENTYSEYLKNPIVFFGDGAAKCREILSKSENARFLDNIFPSASAMISFSQKAYQQQNFENTAYFEPYYLKSFIAGKPKKLI